jgi:hypothetical protein
MRCCDVSLRGHFRNGLVRESDVLLERDGVLDFPENYRKSNNQAAGEKSPVRCKHRHEWDFQIVQAPCDGSTRRLDALVETSKVGELAAVVGQRTHEPVHASLPRGIGEAVEHVKHKGTGIASICPVVLCVGLLGMNSPCTVVGLLEHVTATPDDHDDAKERCPSRLSTGRSADALVIEGKAENVCAYDLHDVVNYSIQGTGPSVEVRVVDLSKVVGVEPVGGKEHGEQENDVRIGEECLPQAHNLRFPRRVLHDDDLGSIRSDNIPRVDKCPGQRSTDQGKDKEANVRAVIDRRGAFGVNVLTQGNLRWLANVVRNLWLVLHEEGA